MRLCANANFVLHLIKPLGFTLNAKTLRRAKMDYINLEQINQYENFNDFLINHQTCRIFYATTKTKILYTDNQYLANDCFVFGPETRGLPAQILNLNPTNNITIPMSPASRSLNLANSVSIITFEAWRQNKFKL